MLDAEGGLLAELGPVETDPGNETVGDTPAEGATDVPSPDAADAPKE